MTYFDEVVGENTQERNPRWLQILDHPYRILIAGASGSGKSNALLSFANRQPHIDKIYLYITDPCEPN